MKKNLFAVVIMLAGALSISPLSLALEKSASNQNLPDVMYASTKLNDRSEKIESKNVSKVENNKSDSDITGYIEKSDVNSESSEKNNSDEQVSAVVNANFNKKAVKNQKRRNSASRKNTVKNTNKKVYSVAKENTKEKYDRISLEQSKKEVKSLSEEEALNLLKKKTNVKNFKYMGDENTFNVLKEKGQYGYVFLPDVQTDLGLFVNKNTKEVYTFHPSGSLDIY